MEKKTENFLPALSTIYGNKETMASVAKQAKLLIEARNGDEKAKRRLEFKQLMDTLSETESSSFEEKALELLRKHVAREKAKDIADAIQTFCEGTGGKVTPDGVEVEVDIPDLSSVMAMPSTGHHPKDHYYSGKMMPEIKHGFAFQGDAEPSFFKDFKWSSEYDEIYTYSDWKNTGEETRARLVNYFMSGEYVTLEFDNGHAITVLPCQVQFNNDDIDDMELKIRDFKDVVADYAHSIPDMFRYLHEHHVALGFHPVKTPRTLKLLHDISLHALRPMTVDCPNENMQEAIKEILWHMNNHVREGDVIVLHDTVKNEYFKTTVFSFDKQTGKVQYKRAGSLGSPEAFYLSEERFVMKRYFGIERWAYRDGVAAHKAADEYLEELNNVQIKPGSVQTDGVNAESKD